MKAGSGGDKRGRAVQSPDAAIKVGFGPATTANSFHQSGVKVAAELEKDVRFKCGLFSEPFTYEGLRGFDVLVFIKIIPEVEILKRLKADGKTLLLDYQDMFLFPSAHERGPVKKLLKMLYYLRDEFREKKRLRLFDRCLVASPVAEQAVRNAGMTPFTLERQIYNDWNRANFKSHNTKTSGLTILWTGVWLNAPENLPVLSVLEGLCKAHSCKVVYLTQPQSPPDGFIEYRRWTLETWERDLLEADISFRWWRDSNTQYLKDSNKVISYMAAGLPVVCRPTLSDRLVIEDGSTGFFAETEAAFGRAVERLILDPALRRLVGERAHEAVWSRYSLERHAEKLKGLIIELTGSLQAGSLTPVVPER